VAAHRCGTEARPCVLCNQRCQVRDVRNPIVSCIADPRSGHETVDPDPELPTGADHGRSVLIVGGGPAGLESARILALHGHPVRVLEGRRELGGALAIAACGPGRTRLAELTSWLAGAIRRLGVDVQTSHETTPREVDAALAAGEAVIVATGSRPLNRVPWPEPPTVDGLTALEAGLSALPDGPIVVDDPVGGPIGVGIAEWLAEQGRDVTIVSPDSVIGTQLAITGDLVAANGRLQRAKVGRELRTEIVAGGAGMLMLEDVWTGRRRDLACSTVIDCGHRQAEDTLYTGLQLGARADRAGDCIAPRTVYEAILEGRRAALRIVAEPRRAIPESTTGSSTPNAGRENSWQGG
jgi:NADPH-dependent 2,4-dienoyl-CoA reductase/sulfur reductase-like enzyme